MGSQYRRLEYWLETGCCLQGSAAKVQAEIPQLKVAVLWPYFLACNLTYDKQSKWHAETQQPSWSTVKSLCVAIKNAVEWKQCNCNLLLMMLACMCKAGNGPKEPDFVELQRRAS